MKHRAGIYEKYVKRLLDILLSAVLLILLSPVMGAAVICVRLKLGSPVLFRQERPGRDGKLFTIYKLRTMTDARNDDGSLKSDGERLTSFGRFLRAASLDELPEIWNIFTGKMSFVGPRPLLPEYLPLYSERQARRHLVLPGLTGLAQVNGRNAISWEEKFEYDAEYVDNISFLLDLKIVLKTVGCVFRRSGISAAGSATMEPFRGSAETVADVREGIGNNETDSERKTADEIETVGRKETVG